MTHVIEAQYKLTRVTFEDEDPDLDISRTEHSSQMKQVLTTMNQDGYAPHLGRTRQVFMIHYNPTAESDYFESIKLTPEEFVEWGRPESFVRKIETYNLKSILGK